MSGDTTHPPTPTGAPQPRAMVLDIEGATTSISFVYDAMFPFVREHLDAYLQDHWGSADMEQDAALLREQSLEDAREGLEGAVVIPGPEETSPDERRLAVRDNVLWQMDHDRKTTGLKSLQGRIWKAGFSSGRLQGHVFDDVPPALSAWKRLGIPVYIYSSGSVAAQKLLFGHSVAGDLTPLLAGHFDTRIGSKKEASSYLNLARSVSLPPQRLCFITDNPHEAAAATEAGFEVHVSIRPGNSPLPEDHGFSTLRSLTPLLEEEVNP